MSRYGFFGFFLDVTTFSYKETQNLKEFLILLKANQNQLPGVGPDVNTVWLW
jgi:hypothetical protein